MIKWFIRHFKFNYIGYAVSGNIRGTGHITMLFFMTASGRRRIWFSIPRKLRASAAYDAEYVSFENMGEAWARGGPFPSNFKPDDNGLQYLIGLVNEKLGVGQ